VELGQLLIEPTAAGAQATIPEGYLEYHKDTDKLYKSDGTTKTELASGGGGSVSGPRTTKYDPDRTPSNLGTGGFSEDYLNNAATQTWTWGNKDSLIETFEMNGITLTGDASVDERRMAWTPALAGVDQTFMCKMHVGTISAASTYSPMIGALITGTIAAPTLMEFLQYWNAAYYFLSDDSYTSPTVGTITHGSTVTTYTKTTLGMIPWYWQMRYIDSTKNLSAYYSIDGRYWNQLGSTFAMANAPQYWGYGLRHGGSVRYEWIRLRTGTDKNLAGE
jgi:hypothetical protein